MNPTIGHIVRRDVLLTPERDGLYFFLVSVGQKQDAEAQAQLAKCCKLAMFDNEEEAESLRIVLEDMDTRFAYRVYQDWFDSRVAFERKQAEIEAAWLEQVMVGSSVI